MEIASVLYIKPATIERKKQRKQQTNNSTTRQPKHSTEQRTGGKGYKHYVKPVHIKKNKVMYP